MQKGEWATKLRGTKLKQIAANFQGLLSLHGCLWDLYIIFMKKVNSITYNATYHANKLVLFTYVTFHKYLKFQNLQYSHIYRHMKTHENNLSKWKIKFNCW